MIKQLTLTVALGIALSACAAQPMTEAHANTITAGQIALMSQDQARRVGEALKPYIERVLRRNEMLGSKTCTPDVVHKSAIKDDGKVIVKGLVKKHGMEYVLKIPVRKLLDYILMTQYKCDLL